MHKREILKSTGKQKRKKKKISLSRKSTYFCSSPIQAPFCEYSKKADPGCSEVYLKQNIPGD